MVFLLKSDGQVLKLKPSKCEFFEHRIAYLGHIVSDKGIKMDPKNIEAIIDWPVPKTVHDVCSFLGFTNYYQKFIYKYAQKAKPLNKLISGENVKKKHSKVVWTDECQTAFNLLKKTCTNIPILAYANYKKPFCLNTDTSEKGLGAVLYQQQDDETFRVIAYARRTLSKTESELAHKLKFLALKWSITQWFHQYLYGGMFEVYTDNNPLMYVLPSAKLDAMGQRWIASLANYDFKIFYWSGHLNVDADSLSRIPWDMEQMYDTPLDTVLVKSVIVQSRVSIKIPIFSNALVTVNELVIYNDLQLSKSQWRQEQKNDFSLKRLIELCQSGKLLNYDTTKEDPADLKSMMRLRKEFFIEGGLLHRKASFKASGK